ncbi:MAG: DUF4097 family beta strand repeat protein [Acholeplasmataceae bacterium]|nr:DUF4097 family beta strand repeat protein [Acholeplasmataceae bacterium]
MKKYLEDLRQELKKKNLSNKEIDEIIADHEEMIQTAMAEGLTEDEIKKKFGQPEQLAEDLADFEAKEESEQSDTNDYKLLKSFDISEKELFVDVKLVSEDIIYQTSDDSTIKIYYRGEGEIDRYDLDYNNGKLELSIQKSLGLGISISINKKNDIDFIIELPKTKIATEFTHKSVSADINIKNLQVKKLNLGTTSGDVVIENSKLGDATWHTVSGVLNVQSTDFDELNSSQVSGDLKLDKITVKGNIKCNTVSGDIGIDEGTCDQFDLHSVSGDLSGNEFYPKKVTLRSVSGNINIENKKDLPIEVGSKRSVSGDIKIN